MVLSGSRYRVRFGEVCMENINGSITSHVLFALKYDEGIATVCFLFFVGLLICVRIFYDANLRDCQQLDASVGV